MKTILFAILICCAFLSSAQNNLSIIYSQKPFEGSENSDRYFQDIKLRMIANDSLSFWYIFFEGKDMMRKKDTIFGKKLLAHGSYYNAVSGEAFSTVYYSRKNKFIFKINQQPLIWRKGDARKNILGYECQSALAVTATGDSILVFYSDSLPYRGGILFYENAPGLILEVFDQRRNVHTIVSEIKFGHYTVVFPSDADMVSEEEKNIRIERYKTKMAF